MGYKYKPSKSSKKVFADKMELIDNFCEMHNIKSSISNDSYYFTINEQDYRVSNHTVDSSNAGAYDEQGNQVRSKYHSVNEFMDTIYITAGKTRIMVIYNDLKAGYELTKRGTRK